MTGHPVHVHHLPSFHTCEMNKRPLPGGRTMPLNDRKWVVMASLPLLPLQRQCVSRITAANQYRNRPLFAGMANHEALS
jgi:hypothetical protein